MMRNAVQVQNGELTMTNASHWRIQHQLNDVEISEVYTPLQEYATTFSRMKPSAASSSPDNLSDAYRNSISPE